MSNITVQDIEKSAVKIQESLASETLVNWDSVQTQQQKLMTGFQATMEKFMQFRDMMQKNFLISLKEMKQLDAKDLLKQVTEKKSEAQVLKSLVDYSAQDGNDIVLDIPALKEDTLEKQKKFEQLTNSGTEKLFETAKWIDEFIKQHMPNQQTVEQAQQQLQQNAVANTSQQVEVPMNFKFDEDKLVKIVSKIKVETIPNTQNLISIKTYSEIVEQSVDLAEGEFIRLTFENRKQRREVSKDTKQYLKLMMDHLNDIENMLMKSQEEICKQLGITQEKLEQSEVTLMERGLGQQLFIMQASVRQKIKERLPKKSDVGASITKEIIQHQIKVLKEKQDQFLPVLKEMPNNYETQQLVPVLLNLMISDIVFEEYNFEEEDYMHNLTDNTYFKEQEIMEMLSGIEQGIVNLLQTSGLIPKGQPGMQGGGFPQMGGMPQGGMPPMGPGGMPGFGF